jgi:DNA-binding NarL/FixJ family response regulator
MIQINANLSSGYQSSCQSRPQSGSNMDHAKHIRVVAVVDHVLLHEAIKALIDRKDRMILVSAESTGVGGLRLIGETRPDVAIVDIELSDMNGLVLAEQIIKEYPNTHVLILTGHEDRAYAQRALQIGVKAYISKRSHVDHLMQGVEVAADGGLYIDPMVKEKLLDGSNAKSFADVLVGTSGSGVQLTEREEDVVRLVALGYSAKEIAGLLDVSNKSVETYRARASEKLGLRSRAQLVRYAVARGWTPND